MATRPFDVVIWGCTGFTGRLVAKYFATRIAKRVPTLRWALAGRSKEKLQTLVEDLGVPAHVMIASADVQDEVDQVAAATKVILSTAGPFAKYGTPVVEACVRSGCDYVDINGETGWHRSMIDAYDEAARKAGVTLVPSSGFDSIPSDLGVDWMARRVLEASGLPVRRVSGYFSMRGAFSGGTVASGILSERARGSHSACTRRFACIPCTHVSMRSCIMLCVVTTWYRRRRTAPPTWRTPSCSAVLPSTRAASSATSTTTPRPTPSIP